MSQFKAGDLALIKQCKTFPEMIGKCVELIEFFPAGVAPDGWMAMDKPAWMVRGESLMYKKGAQTLKRDEALYAELCLMPLRGDFAPETERETELTQ